LQFSSNLDAYASCADLSMWTTSQSLTICHAYYLEWLYSCFYGDREWSSCKMAQCFASAVRPYSYCEFPVCNCFAY
jgi:hypothetical protein